MYKRSVNKLKIFLAESNVQMPSEYQLYLLLQRLETKIVFNGENTSMLLTKGGVYLDVECTFCTK